MEHRHSCNLLHPSYLPFFLALSSDQHGYCIKGGSAPAHIAYDASGSTVLVWWVWVGRQMENGQGGEGMGRKHSKQDKRGATQRRGKTKSLLAKWSGVPTQAQERAGAQRPLLKRNAEGSVQQRVFGRVHAAASAAQAAPIFFHCCNARWVRDEVDGLARWGGWAGQARAQEPPQLPPSSLPPWLLAAASRPSLEELEDEPILRMGQEERRLHTGAVGGMGGVGGAEGQRKVRTLHHPPKGPGWLKA